MTDETDLPDSDATTCDLIVVSDTPQHDNPKFGSVTMTFERGLHGNTFRMTLEDARKLNALLTNYLNETHPK